MARFTIVQEVLDLRTRGSVGNNARLLNKHTRTGICAKTRKIKSYCHPSFRKPLNTDIIDTSTISRFLKLGEKKLGTPIRVQITRADEPTTEEKLMKAVLALRTDAMNLQDKAEELAENIEVLFESLRLHAEKNHG